MDSGAEGGQQRSGWGQERGEGRGKEKGKEAREARHCISFSLFGCFERFDHQVELGVRVGKRGGI